jgi:putative hydroxymethylpyrimidine transport system substrate-binding protein
MRIRTATCALLSAIAVVALAACGSADNKSAGASATGAGTGKALTKVTMVQEWPVADGFWIPWTLGKQKGFYEQEGIDLQIVAPPTVADTMKYLGTGRADVAFTTIMDIVFAREQGAPVTAIGRYTKDNNWGLISKQGKPTTAAALKGKTIGIYNDAWTKAQLGMMLNSAGLKLSDVKTVSAADDTVPLLLRNKVDAITGVTNAEGTEMVTAGKQHGEFLAARDHGVPDSPVWMFGANTPWLQKNPDLAKRFMRATEKSLQYAVDHPDEGVAAYFKAYSKAYDRAFVTQQWKDTSKLFAKSANGSYFSMDDAMWAPLLKAVADHGIVKKVLPAKDYYTNELVGG